MSPQIFPLALPAMQKLVGSIEAEVPMFFLINSSVRVPKSFRWLCQRCQEEGKAIEKLFLSEGLWPKNWRTRQWP